MCGKSTLAGKLRAERGLDMFLCTDTVAQAHRGRTVGALYAPSRFDNDWSGLSLWVAENWLTKPGPWILEGVAAIRALRKHRNENETDVLPCDEIIWMAEPQGSITAKQRTMLETHDGWVHDMIDDWPAFAGMVVIQ